MRTALTGTRIPKVKDAKTDSKKKFIETKESARGSDHSVKKFDEHETRVITEIVLYYSVILIIHRKLEGK